MINLRLVNPRSRSDKARRGSEANGIRVRKAQAEEAAKRAELENLRRR